MLSINVNGIVYNRSGGGILSIVPEADYFKYMQESDTLQRFNVYYEKEQEQQIVDFFRTQFENGEVVESIPIETRHRHRQIGYNAFSDNCVSLTVEALPDEYFKQLLVEHLKNNALLGAWTPRELAKFLIEIDSDPVRGAKVRRLEDLPPLEENKPAHVCVI